MDKQVRRIYVEKKKGFDVEGQGLYGDLTENLGIKGLKSLRIIHRYDVAGISEEVYQKARTTIFSEPPVDNVSDEAIQIDDRSRVFAVEYLPGQYDQRADSAAQCIQILSHGERPQVKVAKLIALEGEISDEQFHKIKDYCINPVEAHEAALDKPLSLDVAINMPDNVEVMHGFIAMDDGQLQVLLKEKGFAMDLDDLKFCQGYFRDTEGRDPSVTELRMIDTYWSDHCRHTTFLTQIDSVQVEQGRFSGVIEEAYHDYLASREFVYGEREKDVCLMDIATIGMKELKKRGMLDDLDESEEINACSIQVNVDVDGEEQEWLVMFKNETHNHPTEIEPFGGAATCLGGAIRDPLSGRAYVYQAMRVTGSADPGTPVEATIPGKLPQRKITVGAAQGYSAYGNQIGLATGHVAEIYDPGYMAKRLEIGAVIGAAPKENVVREQPSPGDVIILLGGRTGRDGCGGATGSSKAHTEESLESCGAEVQKGNPPVERKIQRLFRNPAVTTMIKRCNDFGAGGVSVAIGELADGLQIDLDKVPKKYEGLDGTELAISESQERMAVVVAKENARAFIDAAGGENLEATEVAVVTEEKRLQMFWKGSLIVDINRAFLNTNGAKKNAEAAVKAPAEKSYFEILPPAAEERLPDIKEAWLHHLQDLNVCSQKGLVERFDSSIGAGTVTMPFGGKYQLTPAESMVAKIPVLNGDTTTGTIMAHGYNPEISKWSPFHGAVYAIVEAAAKVAAAGGDYRKIRLTLQEYFERLGQDASRWGKPFSALLGAYHAQMKMGIPAIGGKDSMSGTFMDLDVPPTLVAFAVDTVNVNKVVSNEFKQIGSKVVYIPLARDENALPDFVQLDKLYTSIHEAIGKGKVLAAHTVRGGGLSEAISKMCFGNKIGFVFEGPTEVKDLFIPAYGSILLEMAEGEILERVFDGLAYNVLGHTQQEATIIINDAAIILDQALEKWEQPLEKIFPTRTPKIKEQPRQAIFERRGPVHASSTFAKPRIFMPVFPGTNCEYDTAKAFEKAGGAVDTLVVRNLTSGDIEQSLEEMVTKINEAQIVMLPGGFSAGDEPEGSGKFMAAVFRNAAVKEAVMRLLQQRDGLMLGICNGFQALVKLGLVPYGEIRDIDKDCPTLTFNTIGRHISCMVRTRISSTLSPWFNNVNAGDIHTVAVSHGEGRFAADEEAIKKLAENGQIATQYVDMADNATYDIRYNPNGSVHAIEGITSPDGRIL
ncbi:MAG: phosphoribosylformylglycinamidine synthase, partial [Firmicutes bacterium]|nr:phosphoribosylformylglycinamidine synthase [Bacillota bacterium]